MLHHPIKTVAIALSAGFLVGGCHRADPATPAAEMRPRSAQPSAAQFDLPDTPDDPGHQQTFSPEVEALRDRILKQNSNFGESPQAVRREPSELPGGPDPEPASPQGVAGLAARSATKTWSEPQSTVVSPRPFGPRRSGAASGVASAAPVGSPGAGTSVTPGAAASTTAQSNTPQVAASTPPASPSANVAGQPPGEARVSPAVSPAPSTGAGSSGVSTNKAVSVAAAAGGVPAGAAVPNGSPTAAAPGLNTSVASGGVPQPPAAPTGAASANPPAAGTKPPAAPGETQFADLLQKTGSAATTDADVLAREFSRRIKNQPQEVGGYLEQQLLRFLKDESVPQAETLAPLPNDERELISAVMDGLSNFRQQSRLDPSLLFAKKMKPLLEMSDRLRSMAELSIPTLRLCRRVDGFGAYEPMEPTFRAGVDHEAIIYCEVENFSSRQNNGMWETKLSMEQVLYNDRDDPIYKGRDEVPTDVTRNRRRDFFVVKRLKLPKTLAPAKYVLKVTIVDEQAKRVAEETIPIKITL